MKKREPYETPRAEIIVVENEGIMASSIDSMPNQPWGANRSRGGGERSVSNSSSMQDLEDMINDILTIQ